MVRLFWKCPNCNGMNELSSDLTELEIWEHWYDEYDTDPRMRIFDRCDHCQYLADEALIGGSDD